MQIQINDHETVGTDAKFQTTGHPDILIDPAGRVLILRDDDNATIITVK